MIRILFVCHGNICRSVSAEFMLKDMINKNKLNDKIYCESAAVSREEIGNDIYPPMKPYLEKRGILLKRHYARQINKEDYKKRDLILLFDEFNQSLISRMMDDPENKIHLLTDYVGLTGEISDPWYTWKFDECLNQIQIALDMLLKKIAY